MTTIETRPRTASTAILAVRGVVHDGAVARLALALDCDRQGGCGPVVLRLGAVNGWTRVGLRALVVFLRVANDLMVLPPPGASFLGVFAATDLSEVWIVFGDVRAVVDRSRVCRPAVAS